MLAVDGNENNLPCSCHPSINSVFKKNFKTKLLGSIRRQTDSNSSKRFSWAKGLCFNSCQLANLLQRYQKLFLNILSENKGGCKVGIKMRFQVPAASSTLPGTAGLPCNSSHREQHRAAGTRQVLSTSPSKWHKWNGWIKLFQWGQPGRASNLGHSQGETSFRSSLLHSPEGTIDFNLEGKVCVLLSLGRRQRKVSCHALTSIRSLKEHTCH